MPLLINTLAEELRSVTDIDFSSFVSLDPPTIKEAARRWAQALDNYFQEFTNPIVPPPPPPPGGIPPIPQPIQLLETVRGSATLAAAEFWTDAFSDQDELGGFTTLINFQGGLAAYIDEIVGGMTLADPLYTWVGPPTPPPPFALILQSGLMPPFGTNASAADIARNISITAHTWLNTGRIEITAFPSSFGPWILTNP